MGILDSTTSLLLFSAAISITFSTVIRNYIPNEEQEAYTTAVSEKTTEEIKNENIFLYDTTSKIDEQGETTTCTEDSHVSTVEESTFTTALNENEQTTETVENSDTTTCTEETHSHDKNELATYQRESQTESTKNQHHTLTSDNPLIENDRHDKTTIVQAKSEDKIEDSSAESVIMESTGEEESYNLTTGTIKTDLTPCTNDELRKETSTFSEKKEDDVINKYDYIREKLKPALSEKLSAANQRSKRQSQGTDQQIQSNHSPVYRGQQMANVNSNGQKPIYYPQYNQQQVTPRNKINKAVIRVPVKAKVANNLPPNSGYTYPIDSYLAYTNIKNNNIRYPTGNTANRRQFQQNRPPVPTRRRATPRRTTKKKKFRPMPVFA